MEGGSRHGSVLVLEYYVLWLSTHWAPSDAYNIYVRKLSHYWFRYCFALISHYLQQCRFINNWDPRNKLQWNFDENITTFMQELILKCHHLQHSNHFFQPQYINLYHLWDGGNFVQGGSVKMTQKGKIWQVGTGPNSAPMSLTLLNSH